MAEKSGNIVRSVTIGVLTTVIGATIVYFLGFQDSGRQERKLRKQATAKAWQTYQANLEIFSTVFKRMDDGSDDIERKRTDAHHEIDATLTSFENIKKEANIDSRLISLIDIKAGQLTALRNIVTIYFDEIQAFAAQDPTEEQGYAFIRDIGGRLEREIKALKGRDSIRVASYTEELKKDYDLD